MGRVPVPLLGCIGERTSEFESTVRNVFFGPASLKVSDHSRQAPFTAEPFKVSSTIVSILLQPSIMEGSSVHSRALLLAKVGFRDRLQLLQEH